MHELTYTYKDHQDNARIVLHLTRYFPIKIQKAGKSGYILNFREFLRVVNGYVAFPIVFPEAFPKFGKNGKFAEWNTSNGISVNLFRTPREEFLGLAEKLRMVNFSSDNFAVSQTTRSKHYCRKHWGISETMCCSLH